MHEVIGSIPTVSTNAKLPYGRLAFFLKYDFDGQGSVGKDRYVSVRFGYQANAVRYQEL